MFTNQLKLDFGTATSPLAPGGWLREGVTAYTAARGHGWEAPSGLSAFDSKDAADPLQRDCVRGTTGTYRVDVPSGRYQLKYALIDPREVTGITKQTLNAAGLPDVKVPPSDRVPVTAALDMLAAGPIRLALSNPNMWGIAWLDLLRLGDVAEPLVVNVGPDQTVDVHDVTFAPIITGGVPPYTVREWDYGDGTTGTLDTHRYENGTWTASLKVIDSAGTPGGDKLVVTVSHVHPPAPPPVGDFVDTGHDRIPRFAAAPTLTSARDGLWHDPLTWAEGRVPGLTDLVRCQHHVIRDRDGACMAWEVWPGKHLDERVGTLRYAHGLVLEGGMRSLAEGAHGLYRDVPFHPSDTGQYGVGDIVLGRLVCNGTALRTAYQRLAREPVPGDTVLVLAAPVAGWQAGDRLLLPDSRYSEFGAGNPDFLEEVVTVKSISGTTVTLNETVRSWHPGGYYPDGRLFRLPHVANLTRGITFRSENPLGNRGHMMVTHHGTAQVAGVAFLSMGRTVDGDPIIGRYPGLHTHHCHTDGAVVMTDFVIDEPIVPRSLRRWGLVCHGSKKNRYERGVIHNVWGWGAGTEDGNATGNTFRSIFCAGINGTGNYRDVQEGRPGTAGYGFWFQDSLDNVVEDCVAVDCMGNAYGWVGGLSHTLQFRRCEAYGRCVAATTFWHANGVDSGHEQGNQRGYVDEFTAFNCLIHFGYPCGEISWRKCVGVMGVPGQWRGSGWDAGDYIHRNCELIDCKLHGYGNGVNMPMRTAGGFFRLVNCDLDSFVGWYRPGIGGPGSGFEYGQRKTFLQGVTYGNRAIMPAGNWKGHSGIYSHTNNMNWQVLDTLDIVDHEGRVGESYRVWDHLQHANAVMPPSDGGSLGSPDPGKTNGQLKTAFGVSTGGEIAAVDAVDGASMGVYGLVKRV